MTSKLRVGVTVTMGTLGLSSDPQRVCRNARKGEWVSRLRTVEPFETTSRAAKTRSPIEIIGTIWVIESTQVLSRGSSAV